MVVIHIWLSLWCLIIYWHLASFYIERLYLIIQHMCGLFQKQKFPKSFVSISLSLSNRPPGSPSLLIVGWWSSNTRAQARGSLGSVPNVTCAILSSHIFKSSLSLYLSRPSPSPPLSVLPHEPLYTSPPNAVHPSSNNSCPTWTLVSALPSEKGQ